MNISILVSLLQNAALLLAVSIIYEASYWLPREWKTAKKILRGILAGIFVIAVMALPLIIKPGLIFDTRSILLSVVALHFGPVPALISVLAAASYRISIGGSGLMPGLAVIFSSTLIGLLWRRVLTNATDYRYRILKVYGMGLVVHVVMLACQLLLPDPSRLDVIRTIAWPVILIYPLATLALSQILFRQGDARRVKAALSRSQERYRRYIENAPIGVFVCDEEGRFLEANQAVVEMNGYDLPELLSMKVWDLALLEDRSAGQNLFRSTDWTGKMHLDGRYLRKDGSTGWCLIDAIRIEEGRYLHFVRDISVIKEAEMALVHQSLHDHQTGLFNRRYFEEQKALLDQGGNVPLSILMADINGVRLVNDAFGHEGGDALIGQVSRILEDCIGPEDLLARVGGDEFYMLLPHTDGQGLEDLHDRILEKVRKANGEHRSFRYDISLSMGMGTKTSKEQHIDAIARMAEEHLRNQKLLNSSSYQNSLIASMLATVYEKSQETEEHAKRLADLSLGIGKRLHLAQSHLDQLELLSLLHDIGKVGISDQILKKPGLLDREEWMEMRKHPDIGFRIAKSSQTLAGAGDLIRAHHERWDGSGYPLGLSGLEIPLEARIIGVVDAFDAMTNDRIYRQGISTQDALTEIEGLSGIQFDPSIVTVFVEMMNEKERQKGA